jgi:hypothetical protein
MTQLNSPADAGAFTQQSAGVQVSQEELSLRICCEELARLWDRPLLPRQPPNQQQQPPNQQQQPSNQQQQQQSSNQQQLNQHQLHYQQYQQYLYQLQLQQNQQAPTTSTAATATTTAATATTTTARKQKKRRSEDVPSTPIPNQKTKNSTSEKRGNIVKSIDKLATSIVADKLDNKQASAAAFTQMQMQMQMQ